MPFCDKDRGQFDFMLEKGWQVTFLALTGDKQYMYRKSSSVIL